MEAAMLVPGLQAYERVVLLYLAYRAGLHNMKAWPSVGLIAKDTCMKGRHVTRLLGRLRNKGLIKIVGHTHSGTRVYLLTFPLKPEGVTNSQVTNSQGGTDQESALGCSTVSGGLTKGQTNKVIEQGHPKKDVNPQTSAYAALPGQTSGKPDKANASNKEPKDSAMVKAWKAAHAAAGLPDFHVDAIAGAQLSQLGKGGDEMYTCVRDQLVPFVVSHWTEFCAYAEEKGVHQKSQAPMPKFPSAGFLLAYRDLAFKFAGIEPPKQTSGIILAKKGTIQPALKEPQFGLLPDELPKPQNYNSPVWDGHPPSPKKK